MSGKLESQELGAIEVSDGSTVKVSKFVGRDGKDRIDVRLWIKSERYTGPTKKGVTIPKEMLPELVKILSSVQ
jgi:hypothetical protein